MKRYLQKQIEQDLKKKIVLLMGPRQAGKTTLAKQLSQDYDYLNMDSAEDMVILHQKSWDRDKSFVIFDELHKLPKWKQWLKGVYDKEGNAPNILVTGSAQLNTDRKVGDSLAGRYFGYRLHPIDLQEAKEYFGRNEQENFKRLMECSGFPEPFLSGQVTDYRRWKRTHADMMIRQDLIEEKSVQSIKKIELLIELIRSRVGSGISYANLARHLECDANTVKRWCHLLEDMYILFRVTPFHKNVARSLLKEPKFYCYDVASVKDEAAKLENLVALSVLKQLHWLEDTQGLATQLHYCRTKEGKEIDFMVHIEDREYLIEVKSSHHTLSPNFAYYKKFFPKATCLQLVLTLKRQYSYPDGTMVKSLIPWLSHIRAQLR